MSKQLRIVIPKPCHENWDDMNPNEQGAFCASCQKNVIDFTAKTHNEIYDTLTHSEGKICGRFREDQLNGPITKTEINSSFFNWKAIAASLTALLTLDETFASGDVAPKPAICAPTQIKSDTTILLGKTRIEPELIQVKGVRPVPIDTGQTIIIRGKVIDEITKAPLFDVKVKTAFDNGNVQHTNRKGNFVLNLSSTGNTKITFSGLYGYKILEVPQTELLKLSPINGKKEIIISLQPDFSCHIKGDIAYVIE